MRCLFLPPALCLVASSALAANGADDLQTVVVVGHTLLDASGIPLSEVPSNVQTLSGRAATEQGATNLADALNASLGSVSVSNGSGNPYQNDVNYRGYQATSLLGAPVGLSVYFDGVRMNEPFGSNVNWELIPMNAIDSIGVLPGSNPMFGLNTLGGALVIRTKNGRDDGGISLGGLGGAFQRKAGEFEAGWTDERRKMDYFLSANLDEQEGYRQHSASRVDQLYAKARWQGADDRAQLELSGAYANTSLSGTQALPLDMMADRRAAYTWPDRIVNRAGFLSLKGNYRMGDADRLTGNLYVRTVRTRSENSNAQLDDGCFNDDGSLVMSTIAGVTKARCADKAPDGTALNAVTSAAGLALGFGRWTSSVNSSVVASATHEHTLGAAFQWTHSADLAGRGNTFSLGAQADRSRIGYGQENRLARLENYGVFEIPNLAYGFTANGAIPSAANPPAFTGSNLLSSVDLSSTTRDLALYLTDTLHLTDRLNVTLSGSINHSALEQSGTNAQFLNDDGGYSWSDAISGISYYNASFVPAYRYANTAAGVANAPNGIPAGAVAGPEAHGLAGSHRYRRFNPALGFNYDVDVRLALFGSYSEAMRAPTSIEHSCADPENPCALPTGFNGDPELRAVTAKTFELGGRGRLGGVLSWNAAAYRSRIGNDIQFIATSNSYGYFANVGDTERRGVELGLQGRWNRLFLSANYGLVEAVYKSTFVTAAGEAVASGDRIPGVAASSFKLRAVVDVTPGLSVGGTLVAAGGQYAHGNESNRDPDGRVPGYSVVNLDLNYRYSAALRFTAQVHNAFDQRYSTYGLSGITSLYTLVNQQFQTPAPPRAVWVGATFSFGGKAEKPLQSAD